MFFEARQFFAFSRQGDQSHHFLFCTRAPLCCGHGHSPYDYGVPLYGDDRPYGYDDLLRDGDALLYGDLPHVFHVYHDDHVCVNHHDGGDDDRHLLHDDGGRAYSRQLKKFLAC